MGKSARDSVYVGDVVDATIAAAAIPSSGVYNVGVGKTATFNQIVAWLNEGLETTLAPTTSRTRIASTRTTPHDLTPTKARVKWSPRCSAAGGDPVRAGC